MEQLHASITVAFIDQSGAAFGSGAAVAATTNPTKAIGNASGS
jgi:hypothetical protein